MKPRLPILLCCACCIALLPGCFPFWLMFEDDDDPPVTANGTDPPHIESVEIADWPPIGPDGQVQVYATATAGLSRMEFDFAHHYFDSISGSAATVTAYGSQLGEGFGELTITAYANGGGWARQTVTDLLVDLSPPQATLGETVLRAEGAAFQAWVADGWILGGAELSFQGVSLMREVDPGYPASLGESWDYSLFVFDTAELPTGAATAQLRIWDAAGNQATESFPLTIDGVPPNVTILSPSPDATVAGLFDVSIQASDDGGAPVWVDVQIDGTLVATGMGPTMTLQLDGADFVPGAVDLEATAADEAGNESTVALPLTIAAEP